MSWNALVLTGAVSFEFSLVDVQILQVGEED